MVNMLNNFPDVMSVADLCSVLNIGRNTAYRLLKSGDIKSVRIGNVHKIPKARVIEYLEKSA
jgi:excisionase family DNA binding protein